MTKIKLDALPGRVDNFRLVDQYQQRGRLSGEYLDLDGLERFFSWSEGI